MQQVEGLYGAFIVRAPTPPAMRYDAEATLQIMDYYTDPANETLHNYFLASNSGPEVPVPNATVVNGAFSGALAMIGNRTHAPRLLLRFIAANALRSFNISIDHLVLHVVEIDATPVAPYAVSAFSISPGQRVAVVVNLSTLPARLKSVWLRVDAYPVRVDGTVHKLPCLLAGDAFGPPPWTSPCDASARRLLLANPTIPPPFTPPSGFTAADQRTTENFRGWIQLVPLANGVATTPSGDPYAQPPALVARPASDLNMLGARPLIVPSVSGDFTPMTTVCHVMWIQQSVARACSVSPLVAICTSNLLHLHSSIAVSYIQRRSRPIERLLSRLTVGFNCTDDDAVPRRNGGATRFLAASD